MRLRVVSWNIHSCVGCDRRYDASRIARVLASLNADIIGLQEVDWRSAPFEGTDHFGYLGRVLGMARVAGPNLRDHRGEYGNGLLTRLEVRDIRRVDLAHRAREPRGVLSVLLGAGDFQVRAMVTHLGLARPERWRQLRRIEEEITRDKGSDALVVMGDFNEWLPARLPFRKLRLACACVERSFPSRFPLLTLDRIYLDPAPCRVNSRTVRTPDARAASDHLPIVADIEWDEPGRTSRVAGPDAAGGSQ